MAFGRTSWLQDRGRRAAVDAVSRDLARAPAAVHVLALMPVWAPGSGGPGPDPAAAAGAKKKADGDTEDENGGLRNGI